MHIFITKENTYRNIFIGILFLFSLITSKSVNAQSVDSTDNLFPIFTKAKVQNESINVKKSTFETNEQYQQRLRSLDKNLGEYEARYSPDQSYEYQIETNSLTVSLNVEWKYQNSENYIYIPYRSIIKNSSTKEVICQNGFGAKFKYKNTSELIDKYIFVISNKDSKTEDFKYQINMSTQQAKNYVSRDESKLNSKLKFLIKFTPVLPYYEKSGDYAGGSCPEGIMAKAIADGAGITLSYLYTTHKVFVRVLSVKLYDTTTGQILMNKEYNE